MTSAISGVEFGLLGALEVRRDGETIDLAGYRQRALLSLLLIRANRVVSTDSIIDELWPGDSGIDRRGALQVVVSRLRTSLEPGRPKRSDGDHLITQCPGYLLRIDPLSIDTMRFESLAAEGRRLVDIDPRAASLGLGMALSIWRGRALDEFRYEDWAAPEIERLEELRLRVLEDRIDADLLIGRCHDVVAELRSLVHAHPTRQRMAGQLMLGLHAAGRTAEALHVFDAMRNHLGDEFGLCPATELATLRDRIVCDDPMLGDAYGVRLVPARLRSVPHEAAGRPGSRLVQPRSELTRCSIRRSHR